jgi:septal ring factor EnvC (AmiA/AmiB activator)
LIDHVGVMASDDILHHLNGSSDNSRNLLNEIAQLKKSLAEARTRAAELEEKVERQGKAIAEAEKELLGMDSEYSELRITIEDQYAEIIVLRHELRDAPLDLTREKIGDQYTRNSILNVQPLKRRASDSL